MPRNLKQRRSVLVRFRQLRATNNHLIGQGVHITRPIPNVTRNHVPQVVKCTRSLGWSGLRTDFIPGYS